METQLARAALLQRLSVGGGEFTPACTGTLQAQACSLSGSAPEFPLCQRLWVSGRFHFFEYWEGYGNTAETPGMKRSSPPPTQGDGPL